MIKKADVIDIKFNATLKRENDIKIDLMFLVMLKDRAIYAKAYIDDEADIRIKSDEEIDQEVEDEIYILALKKWREINVKP